MARRNGHGHGHGHGHGNGSAGRIGTKRPSNGPNDYVRRAEAGQVDAQYRLGLIYSTGSDVPLDYITAHKWLNLAAAQGDSEARRLRAELAADMTAADIAEAQRQAREWLACR